MRYDDIDLKDLTKDTSRYSFLKKPFVVGGVTALFLFTSQVIFLQQDLILALLFSLLIGGLLTILLPIQIQGITLPYFLVMYVWHQYMQKRRTDKMGVNYFSLDPVTIKQSPFRRFLSFLPFIGEKYKSDIYDHLTDKLSIYGVKNNVIRVSRNTFASVYHIEPKYNVSGNAERLRLEDSLQDTFNALHQAGYNVRISLTKKELKRNNLAQYLKSLNDFKGSNQLEKVKRDHMLAITERMMNKTLNSYLEIHLAIYVELDLKKDRIITLWQEAEERIQSTVEQINITSDMPLRKMTNVETKTYLAKLYQPLEKFDFERLFTENELMKEQKNKELSDLELEKLEEEIEEMGFIQRNTFKLRKALKYVQEKIRLVNLIDDLDGDVLFYLPRTIIFNEAREYVEVQGQNKYYETTLLIPTNNSIVDTRILRTATEHPNVFNFTIKLEPVTKQELIQKLQMKDLNERSKIEEEERKGYSDLVGRSKRENAISYMQEIIQSRNKEVFNAYVMINISAESRERLRESVKEVKNTLTTNFNLPVFESKFEQEQHYNASKIPLKDKSRDYFLLDSDRISGLIPLPTYSFSDPNGILLGRNARSGYPAFYDARNRFAGDSLSAVILGKPGVGKSSMMKLLFARNAFLGIRQIVIDTNGEYTARVAQETDSKIFSIGLSNNHTKINPFELFKKYKRDEEKDVIRVQIANILIPFFSILLDQKSFHDGVLDKVLNIYYETELLPKNLSGFVKYLKKYITDEFQSELLDRKGRDIKKKIKSYFEHFEQADQNEKDHIQAWIKQLERFNSLSLRNIFGEGDDFSDLGQYRSIVFDITDIKEIKGVGEKLIQAIMHIIISNLNLLFKTSNEQTVIFIDEAHFLLGNPSTAKFLATLVKEGRKENLIPYISTQDVRDFFSTEEGKNILASVEIKILGRIDDIPDEIVKILDLTPDLQATIKALNRGELFIKRKKDSMFVSTEFFNEWDHKITDTETTNYRDSLDKLKS